MTQSKKRESPLKTLREAAGLTQPELSQRLHCGIRIISHWENGTKVPKFDNAVALARELNVSLKTLAKAIGIDVSDIPDDIEQVTNHKSKK